MDFSIIATLVAILAGAVASISGFGIGSLLTPLIAIKTGTKLAIALVAIPHFVGTVVRCWMLRHEIDRTVLISFGITSALGGLLGALLHSYLQTPQLTLIFACILIFAGFMGATGLMNRLRLHGFACWIAGAISGGLGGLVGNQGGIRSAAMLTFELKPRAFVATATAIGVLVDIARLPVYLITEFREISSMWQLVLLASTGVLVGTFCGTALLKKIEEKFFKRLVSIIILALGIWLLFRT